VLVLVRETEPLLELLDPRIVDGTRGHLRPHLVALPRVAAIGEPPDQPPVLRHRVRVELRGRLRDELLEACRQPRVVERLERVALGGDELVLQAGPGSAPADCGPTRKT